MKYPKMLYLRPELDWLSFIYPPLYMYKKEGGHLKSSTDLNFKDLSVLDAFYSLMTAHIQYSTYLLPQKTFHVWRKLCLRLKGCLGSALIMYSKPHWKGLPLLCVKWQKIKGSSFVVLRQICCGFPLIMNLKSGKL